MNEYRLYFENAEGRFVRALDLEAGSDREAMEYARGLDHAHGVEVWSRDRMVGVVRPGSRESAAGAA